MIFVKRLVIFLVPVIIIFSVQCSSSRKSSYQFPDEMPAAMKANFSGRCDKGLQLFESHCAGCHVKIVKGKRVIPDFRPEQLEEYELRAKNSSHKKNLSEEVLSEDQLEYIVLFLKYKKKNSK